MASSVCSGAAMPAVMVVVSSVVERGIHDQPARRVFNPDTGIAQQLSNQSVSDSKHIGDKSVEVGFGAAMINVRHSERELPVHTHTRRNGKPVLLEAHEDPLVEQSRQFGGMIRLH